MIRVHGDIVCQECKHYAQGMSAGGIATCDDMYHGNTTNYHFDSCTHEVYGNLILDKSFRSVPYARYIVDGGICGNNISVGGLCDLSFTDFNSSSLRTTSCFSCMSGYEPAFLYYKDNIDEIVEKVGYPIPDEIANAFYYGLFTGTFSVFELFLSDFILCGIFSDSNCFDRAVSYINKCLNKTGNRNEIQLDDASIGIKIRDHFTTKVVYHKLDMVKSIFGEILKIGFPNYKNIKDLLHPRNNIVHRYGLANIDRMQVYTANKNDVNELINECNQFVSKLKLSLS